MHGATHEVIADRIEAGTYLRRPPRRAATSPFTA